MNSTNPRPSSSSCSGSAGLTFPRFFVESCLYFIFISLSTFLLELISAKCARLLLCGKRWVYLFVALALGQSPTRDLNSFDPLCLPEPCSHLFASRHWSHLLTKTFSMEIDRGSASNRSGSLAFFRESHGRDSAEHPRPPDTALGKSSPCGPTALSAWRF